MKLYLLDTNRVSYLIKSHPVVARRVMAVPMSSLCISAITEGELWVTVHPPTPALPRKGGGSLTE